MSFQIGKHWGSFVSHCITLIFDQKCNMSHHQMTKHSNIFEFSSKIQFKSYITLYLTKKGNMSHHQMTKQSTYLNSAQKSDQSDVVKYWKSYQVYWSLVKVCSKSGGVHWTLTRQAGPVMSGHSCAFTRLWPDFYQTPMDSTGLLPDSPDSAGLHQTLTGVHQTMWGSVEYCCQGCSNHTWFFKFSTFRVPKPEVAPQALL